MCRILVPLATGLAMALGAVPALAGPNLITNGSFELTTGTLQSGGAAVAGQITNTDLPGWTEGGTGSDLDVLYTPGSADTAGAANVGSNGTVRLYGPGGGTGAAQYSNNGMPATSPDGGNYVAVDGDPTWGTTLMQSVSGLAIGTNYQLSFMWAGAREAGSTGTSYESWSVTFGNTTFSTGQDVTVAKGFSPWQTATMVFNASATTQLLTFLAVGGPTGSPPFSLLDGVSLVAVPEPASWSAILGALALGLAGVRRRFGRGRVLLT